MSDYTRYRTAKFLLDELGITEPEDICIAAIAQHCNATIIYKPLVGCAARLVGQGDRAIISVDQDANQGRQRFSAAHELGHWLFHRLQVTSLVSCQEQVFWSEWGQQKSKENQANTYASDLLLPEFLFTPRVRNLEITFQVVKTLAELFQTSITATAIRLVQLGSFPAMIVCHSKQGRQWFVRGPDVPTVIWPLDKPGIHSVAHDLLRGDDVPGGPVIIQADNWISHNSSRHHRIQEDAFRLRGGEVLSLLWWKDESQLSEIEEQEDDRDSE